MPNKERAKADVLQGTLDLMVLQTLFTMGPQHGYQIAARLEMAVGARLSDGTDKMLDEGMIVDVIFEKTQEVNRAGVTILMVEQNARRALGISHRGYVLELGKERFEGAGQDLLDDPKVAELYLGGAALAR